MKANQNKFQQRIEDLEQQVAYWKNMAEEALSAQDALLEDESTRMGAQIGSAGNIIVLEQAEAALNQRSAFLDALHETTLGLMSRLNLGELLEAIVGRAADLVKTKHGFLFLYDSDKEVVELKVGLGIYGQKTGFCMKPGEGLAGKVWLSGSPMVVDDYRSWEGRHPDPYWDAIENIVGIPLKSGGRVTGVIGLINNKPGKGFRKETIDVLSRFGELAAIALNNSRLYEEIKELNESLEQRVIERTAELDKKNEYLKVLNNLAFDLARQNELDELLRLIVSRALELIGSAHGCVFAKIDQDTLEIKVGQGIYGDYIGYHTKRGAGLSGKVLETNSALVKNDYSNWAGRHPDSRWSSVKACIGVPLVFQGEFFGALVLAYTEDGKCFGKNEVDILNRFAALAAASLANAELHAKAKRDLEERKRAEEAVTRERDRAQQYLNIAGTVIVALSPDQTVSLINKKGADVLGYSAEEVIGKNWFDNFIHHSARDQVKAVFDSLMAGKVENVEYYENSVLTKTGEEKTIAWHNTLIRDETGKIVSTLSSGEDITNRKKAEEALRESEERYRTIIEGIEDAYFEVDLAGNLTFFNDALERIVNSPNETLMGLHYEEYTDREDAEKIYRAYNRVFKTGEPLEGFEYDIIRPKDGARINVEVTVSLIRNFEGQPTGFRGILRDITKRKDEKLELQKAKEAAEAASEAKSEFLANMSHEIRTPMNGIIGHTGLALDTDLTEEQREYLEAVRMSSDHLLGIVNDILDFSKIEAGHMELEEIDFDLRTAVDFAAEALAVKAEEKDLELVCHVKPEVPEYLMGDPGRLRQVIVNLVGNAIKFTDAGEILICCEVEHKYEDSIMLHFTVSDTGIGISPEKLGLIFESFSQVDGSATRKYGGTGLGLAISKRFIEMMGGRIWVESEVGKGSIFHFRAKLGFMDEKGPPTWNLDSINPEGQKALIIDDNATNRRILREMVFGFGLFAKEAAHGEEGVKELKRAAKEAKPYDLILMDYQMPEMDGFEASKQIRENPDLGDTKILMLTSSGMKGDAARCVELGISAYLVKPIKQLELFDAIKMALSQEEREAATGKKDLITRHRIMEERQRQRLSILLAEDNFINQQMALKVLEKLGHSVTVAENGQEALDQVEKGPFDLVFMDVQMPVMDGLNATRAIREKENGPATRIPIIAMTAHAMKGDKERCLEAGMDDYISKPVDPQALQSVIEKWSESDRDGQMAS